MKNIKHILLTGAMLLTAIFCANAKRPIQGIIITGQNNHNWPVKERTCRTSPSISASTGW